MAASFQPRIDPACTLGRMRGHHRKVSVAASAWLPPPTPTCCVAHADLRLRQANVDAAFPPTAVQQPPSRSSAVATAAAAADSSLAPPAPEVRASGSGGGSGTRGAWQQTLARLTSLDLSCATQLGPATMAQLLGCCSVLRRLAVEGCKTLAADGGCGGTAGVTCTSSFLASEPILIDTCLTSCRVRLQVVQSRWSGS